MNKMKMLATAVALFATLMTGCSDDTSKCTVAESPEGAVVECGDNHVLVPSGAAGDTGRDAVSDVMRLDNIPPGNKCKTGGVMISAGPDSNGNGVLDTSEIDGARTRVICNGEAELATNEVVRLEVIPMHDGACPTGGTRILVGPDRNHDGNLDDDEVRQSTDVCNGAAAEPVNQLVDLVDVPEGASTDCAYGGVAICVGPDTNNNEVLDSDEVVERDVICHSEYESNWYGQLSVQTVSDAVLAATITRILNRAGYGSLVLESNFELQKLTMPLLKVVEGYVYADSTPTAQGLSLPKLQRALEVTIVRNSHLKTVSLPSLEYAKSLYFVDNPSLPNCMVYRLGEQVTERMTNAGFAPPDILFSGNKGACVPNPCGTRTCVEDCSTPSDYVCGSW